MEREVTIDIREVAPVQTEHAKELARLHAEGLWEEGYKKSLNEADYPAFAARIEQAWLALMSRADYTLVSCVMALIHCQSIGFLSIHSPDTEDDSLEGMANAAVAAAAVLAHSLATNIVSFIEAPEVIPSNDRIRNSSAATIVFRVADDE